MKLLKNSGTDRVVDELRQCLASQGALDLASPSLSLFACGELHDLLSRLASCQLVLPSPRLDDLLLLGTASDRTYYNRLQVRRLARQCAAWLEAEAEVRTTPGTVLQSTLIVGSAASGPQRVITGTCSCTSEGLGITHSTNLSLIQVAESAEECALLSNWFTALWSSLPATPEPKRALVDRLRELTAHRDPSRVDRGHHMKISTILDYIPQHQRPAAGGIFPRSGA